MKADMNLSEFQVYMEPEHKQLVALMVQSSGSRLELLHYYLFIIIYYFYYNYLASALI